jgi:hypothetical protein
MQGVMNAQKYLKKGEPCSYTSELLIVEKQSETEQSVAFADRV